MHKYTKQQEKHVQCGTNPTQPRAQSIERWADGEQANNQLFSLSCLGRTRQGKSNDCATGQFLSPPLPPWMRPEACAPAVGHHATTWCPRAETAHSVNGQESPHNLSLTGQPTASAQLLEVSCSLSAAWQEWPGLVGDLAGGKATAMSAAPTTNVR